MKEVNRILILDDEPWQVSWITPIARSHGWEAFYAGKYDDAERLFKELNPKIVVVDVRIGNDAPPAKGATLEALDQSWVGLRFVRFVRAEQRSTIPIFVYSGVDREDLRRNVEEGFGAKFCSKFDSEYFEMRLEKAIEECSGK